MAFQHTRPRDCERCGVPIRGAYDTRTKSYATKCRSCSRMKGAHPGDRRAQGRDYHLRKKYGITLVEYQALVAAQGGVCAVCGSPPVGRGTDHGEVLLHVDHCHATGRVRGLLCYPCNAALGYVDDDAARMRALAEYVEHHASL